ncbi:hypothetical protein CI610_03462 [invertebrate metagenome]|uniref:Uncharacterized protein n=1 Tax=invertebrate metagenome TaxID=1711999 RepID=A0A2H9T313_9ZZZZ
MTYEARTPGVRMTVYLLGEGYNVKMITNVIIKTQKVVFGRKNDIFENFNYNSLLVKYLRRSRRCRYQRVLDKQGTADRCLELADCHPAMLRVRTLM